MQDFHCNVKFSFLYFVVSVLLSTLRSVIDGVCGIVGVVGKKYQKLIVGWNSSGRGGRGGEEGVAKV